MQRIAVGLVLVVIVASGAAVTQGAPPQPPMTLYGDVTVNGDPADAGTEIVAYVDGERVGSITTARAGAYGGDGPYDPKLEVTCDSCDGGETVTFTLRESAATQTVTFTSGETKRLDLSFDGVQTPTPTPEPSTPTPEPDTPTPTPEPDTPTPTTEPDTPTPTSEPDTPTPTPEPDTPTPTPEPDTPTPTPEPDTPTPDTGDDDSETDDSDDSNSGLSPDPDPGSGADDAGAPDTGSGTVGGPETSDSDDDPAPPTAVSVVANTSNRYVGSVSAIDPSAPATFRAMVDASTSASIQSVSIDTTTAEENVTVVVENQTTIPSSVPEPGANTVGVISVETASLSDDAIDTATFEFSLDSSTLGELGIDSDAVTLYRYHDGWQSLPTTHAGGSSYRAVSPGFSTFAVGTTRADVEVVSATLRSETITAGEQVVADVRLRNAGGTATNASVALTANGERLSTTTIDIGPDTDRTVAISGTLSNTGTYSIAANGTDAGPVTVEAMATSTPSPTATTPSTPSSTSTATDTSTGGAAVETESSGGSIEAVDLTTDPVQAAVGQSVTVTGTFENVGTTEWTDTLTLETAGSVIASEQATLAPGERRTLSGTVTFDQPGAYEIAGANSSVTVTVAEQTQSPLEIGSFGSAVLGLLALLAIGLALIAYWRSRGASGRVDDGGPL